MVGLSLIAATLLAAGPGPRIAVILEDPAPASPARAAIETQAAALGVEIVSAEISAEIRKTISPKEVLEGRLPAGLSVLEADAILAGAIAYGPPTDVDGVKSVQVRMSARLIDLATGRVTSTVEVSSVGLGVDGPNVSARGASKAVEELMKSPRFTEALAALGQASGMVTLIVQALPSRAGLSELKTGLEGALAGAPVKELYFAKGLGKLVIGGPGGKAFVGPDIADLLAEHRELSLRVDEVANSRIVATWDRTGALAIHALILEPVLPKASLAADSAELGRFVANEVAKFGYARASYQPTRLNRKQAQKRAQELGADVIVESEILGSGASQALVIRVVDARSGRPLLREQSILGGGAERFGVAEKLLSGIKLSLADRLKAGPKAPPDEGKQVATEQVGHAK
ncbi:MAG: hypothetical protein U1E65_29025 [Myxococcota bacterium]